MRQQKGRRESPSNHSPSKTHSRQYRLQINKITKGMPQGTYLAYCVVSKESSMGLFVHQRLLVLDTANKSLSYYSELPQLPLQNIQCLGKPKETVNYLTAKRFEFALERIRIGHVNVRWVEKNEIKNWKLIMGSNKLAEQFSRLILDDSSTIKTTVEPVLTQSKAIEIPPVQSNGKEKKIVTEQLHRQQTKEQLQVSVNAQQNQIKQIRMIPSEPPISAQKPAVSVSEDIKRVQKQTEDYFTRNYVNISIQKSAEQQTKPVSYHNYHAYNPLVIPDFSEPIEHQKVKTSMVDEWLDATDGHGRAVTYKKFTSVCEKKVEFLMQDLYGTHLEHEQEDGMCVIYDREIRYIYCPLLDSLQELESPEKLAQKVRQQQKCFEEWQSLNYMSGFQRIATLRVMVPLSCIISYKGVKFYCKAMIDYYSPKQLLTQQSPLNQQVSHLQQKAHVKLRTHHSRIYILQNKNGNIIYLDKINCLPHLDLNCPLSYQYIQNYISNGIISSENDLSTIKQHIHNELISEAIQIVNRKQVSSAFEVAQNLKDIGLTHHFMPLVERKAKKGYFKRLLLSQIVAYAVLWEIRRKMQIQLFKKKDIGFAINQAKKSLNSLFQSQSQYLKLISKIIQAFYNQKYDFQIYPIDTYIVGEAVLTQVLFRIGFDSKIFLNDKEIKDWIWRSQNISNKLQLTVLPIFQTLRWTCFSTISESLVNKHLFELINYEIKTQSSVSSVLQILKVEKDSKGLFKVSTSYEMLGTKQRIQIDYYLSHFIVPTLDGKPQNCLQSTIYYKFNKLDYSVHCLQFLTALNNVRWLIKEKHHHQAQRIVLTIIRRAIIWNQAYALVQIYSFYSQYKLKQGDIHTALEYSTKAFQVALEHYGQQRTIIMELLIAEQAFQTANIYYGINNFSKALQLFSEASKVLKRLSFPQKTLSLNPEFILLYYKKCSIYLVFGQYQNCLHECLQGLNCAKTISFPQIRLAVDQKEFMLYEVLFRCYEIQNMRKQIIEVAEICSHKYFEDLVLANQEVDERLFGEVVKMAWIAIIKQIEIIFPLTNSRSEDFQQIKYIQLKRVWKELQKMRNKLKGELRRSPKEATTYIAQRITRKKQERVENRLKGQIILSMVEASTRQLQLWEGTIFSEPGLNSEGALMEMLAILTSFDFLVGSIQTSLHLYSFQY